MREHWVEVVLRYRACGGLVGEMDVVKIVSVWDRRKRSRLREGAAGVFIACSAKAAQPESGLQIPGTLSPVLWSRDGRHHVSRQSRMEKSCFGSTAWQNLMYSAFDSRLTWHSTDALPLLKKHLETSWGSLRSAKSERRTASYLRMNFL